MNNLVSIIVPVYNVDKYLETCVNSILNQSFKNIEIILIDDGSTDNSGNICDYLEKNDCRIKVFHKQNGGVSSARNVGLDNAKGEYICFVDSDDTLESNMIKVLYENIIKYDTDLSICGFSSIRFDKKKKHTYNSLLVKSKKEFHKNHYIFGGFLWNKMFKRDLIKDLRFNEIIYFCEDELFVTQYVENCGKIYYDSKCLYNYYQYDNSASNWKKWNDRKVSILKARDEEFKILFKYGFDSYVDYFISDFITRNDIYHRYSHKNVDSKKLKYDYYILQKSNLINNKLKIRCFIKYRFFWLDFYKRIFSNKIKTILKK